MELFVFDVKFYGFWDSFMKYVSYSSQTISIPFVRDFCGFKSLITHGCDFLDAGAVFSMKLELISDSNVSKYVPFENDSDYIFLFNFLNVDCVTCALIVEVEQSVPNVVLDIPDVPNVNITGQDNLIGAHEDETADVIMNVCDVPDADEIIHVRNVSDVQNNICGGVADDVVVSVTAIGENIRDVHSDDGEASENVRDISEDDQDFNDDDIVNVGIISESTLSPKVSSQNRLRTDGVYIPDGFRYVDRLDLRDYRRIFTVSVNDIYASKSLLKMAIKILALKNNFNFIVVRSNINRVYYACHCDDCDWKLHASRFKKSKSFVIHTLNDKHTCPIDYVRNDHTAATSDIIAEFVKEFYPPVRGKIIKPYDIQEMMRSNHGIFISYAKARAAREIVLNDLRGSPEASFKHLHKFCHVLLENNPGTVLFVEYTDEFRFKYFFMALKVSISGFNYCRPVLSVDGTFLKNKYGGTMLAAVCMDANNQIFPVAVAIVDSENDLSWEWFFIKLKDALGKDIPGLAIISDRHGSIKKAVEKVFPYSQYGYCSYHLSNNIKARFKKKGLADIFLRAARAYTIQDFEHHASEMYTIAPLIESYLEVIGKTRWARAFFDGLRFNIMTTNISESFNSAMTRYREYPIIAFIEEVLLKLQSWIHDRRSAAILAKTTLSSWVHSELHKRIMSGRRMKVRDSDGAKFLVSDVHDDYSVDINQRKCSCRKWQLELFPCAHACSVLSFKNLPTLRYVNVFYTRDSLLNTYAGSVYPTGRMKKWDVPRDIQFIHLLPPDCKRAAGRPRKRRIPSVGEFKVVLKCGRCNQSGHNRTTCQNALPIVPFSQSKKTKF